MKEEYFKWYSPHLNRDVEMLVFGHAGYPVVLFPPPKVPITKIETWG